MSPTEKQFVAHSDHDLDTKYDDEAHTAKGHFSSELNAALKDTHFRRWSKNALVLYLGIFTSLCCSYANGYDGSLMTALIAMAPFQERFNHIGTGGPMIGALFALYNVGAFIGAPVGALLSDRLGRRWAMAIGSVIIIIGTIVSVTAHHIEQMMVGRVILGWAISTVGNAAPSYSMEIALLQWRGRCTGIYNTGWYAGAIPAAAITFGTNYINSNLSWQLPLIFQCAAAVIVLTTVWFIPESPRFLMGRGRTEEAREFLIKYHGNGDPNAPLVALQMEEMSNSIHSDDLYKTSWYDYRPLFATRGNRWRMLQVIMMSIFGQFSGNGLAYFATVIFEKIGVRSVEAQLGYNLLYAGLAAVGAFVGAMLTDYMPRRKVLTFGTLLLSVTLGVFTGLTSIIVKQMDRNEPINEAIGKGCIAVYVLFGVFCAFTYTPLQAVLPVEALSTPMRAKGMAVCNMVMMCMGFINMFAGPIGLQNIGYRYIFVFVFWDLIEAACWWFFGVESRGRTLEELDWIYDQPNPVAASKGVL